MFGVKGENPDETYRQSALDLEQLQRREAAALRKSRKPVWEHLGVSSALLEFGAAPSIVMKGKEDLQTPMHLAAIDVNRTPMLDIIADTYWN